MRFHPISSPPQLLASLGRQPGRFAVQPARGLQAGDGGFHLVGPAGVLAQVAHALAAVLAETKLEVWARALTVPGAVLAGDEAVVGERREVRRPQAKTAEGVRAPTSGGQSRRCH